MFRVILFVTDLSRLLIMKHLLTQICFINNTLILKSFNPKIMVTLKKTVCNAFPRIKNAMSMPRHHHAIAAG